MITITLDDKHIRENLKAIADLKELGIYTDEEIQEMYDRQVAYDRFMEGGAAE